MKHVKRMDLSHHLKEECAKRKHQCKLCGETGTYQDLGPTHERNCLKRKVNCTNTGCGKNMEYRLLNEHVTNECDHTVIPCNTCGTEVKRKNWKEHLLHDNHHRIHEALINLVGQTVASFEKIPAVILVDRAMI